MPEDRLRSDMQREVCTLGRNLQAGFYGKQDKIDRTVEAIVF